MSDDANKLRLGLVGCSWFALRCHIPALLAPPLSRLVSLTAVCSRTKKSMAKAEARAGLSLKRHAEMRAMFADPEVDAVLLDQVRQRLSHALVRPRRRRQLVELLARDGAAHGADVRGVNTRGGR